MKNIINNIFKGSISKNILLITGGTAFAQVITLFTSPILTRIYSPEEFGVLTIYTSILGLLAGSQSLRYELAIPIIEDDESTINIMGLSLIILMVSNIGLVILLFLWGDYFLSILSASNLLKYRYLIPLGSIFYGIYQIFMMWNFRRRDFKSISKTKLTQSIVSNITKLALGFFSLGPIGLIIGRILGESAGINTLSKELIVKEKALLKLVNGKKMVYLAKRYIRFPLYSLPSTFLSKFATQLPIFFIAYNFGDSAVGYFGFAIGIVSLPITLIGNSVGDVFYSEAAAIGKSDPRRLNDLSKTFFKKLSLLGILPLIILVILAPFLFQIVFGNEWYIAGEYAKILAFLSYAQLIFQPVSRIYDIYERQKDILVITMIRILTVVLVFIISILINLKVYTVITLYTVSMILIYAITYIRANKILNDEISKLNN